MRGFAAKRSLNFRLLSRAVPAATRSTISSPTLRQIVLAICSGATPCAAAASGTVAELTGGSTTLEARFLQLTRPERE